MVFLSVATRSLPGWSDNVWHLHSVCSRIPLLSRWYAWSGRMEFIHSWLHGNLVRLSNKLLLFEHWKTRNKTWLHRLGWTKENVTWYPIRTRKRFQAWRMLRITATITEKDVFRLVTSVEQKNSESPWMRNRTSDLQIHLYHWATETPRWARSITKFIWHTSCILIGSASWRIAARNPEVWGSIPYGDSDFFLCPTLVKRRWLIYDINSVDNTKLPCYTLPPMQLHSFFRNLPSLIT